MKNDVTRLPLSGRAAGIDERRILAEHGTCLTVGVCHIVVRIENLHLVRSHQKYPAVSTFLTFTTSGKRGPPLDMELSITEPAFRFYVSRLRNNLHVAVAHFPLRRSGVDARRAPLVEILSVEKNNRVGRCGNRCSEGTGVDDGRLRPIHRMLRPSHQLLFIRIRHGWLCIADRRGLRRGTSRYRTGDDHQQGERGAPRKEYPCEGHVGKVLGSWHGGVLGGLRCQVASDLASQSRPRTIQVERRDNKPVT